MFIFLIRKILAKALHCNRSTQTLTYWEIERMFYEVKILNPQGKIIKIISGQELGKRYWKAFFIAEANKTLNSSSNQRVPNWVKKRLDMEYAHFGDKSIPA